MLIFIDHFDIFCKWHLKEDIKWCRLTPCNCRHHIYCFYLHLIPNIHHSNQRWCHENIHAQHRSCCWPSVVGFGAIPAVCSRKRQTRRGVSGCTRGSSGGRRAGFLEETVDKRIVKIVNNELTKCPLGKTHHIMYNPPSTCLRHSQRSGRTRFRNLSPKITRSWLLWRSTSMCWSCRSPLLNRQSGIYVYRKKDHCIKSKGGRYSINMIIQPS